MDEAKVDALIKTVDLFNGLTREEVAKIFGRGLTMRVAKGDIVFYKDTVGNQMYVVLGGKVGVYHGKKLIATLRTGDMFGEMALISKDKRSATVVALEDASLFVLQESTFEKLMTKRAAIRILLNIVRTLSHRLRDANAKLSG